MRVSGGVSCKFVGRKTVCLALLYERPRNRSIRIVAGELQLAAHDNQRLGPLSFGHLCASFRLWFVVCFERQSYQAAKAAQHGAGSDLHGREVCPPCLI